MPDRDPKADCGRAIYLRGLFSIALQALAIGVIGQFIVLAVLWGQTYRDRVDYMNSVNQFGVAVVQLNETLNNLNRNIISVDNRIEGFNTEIRTLIDKHNKTGESSTGVPVGNPRK